MKDSEYFGFSTDGDYEVVDLPVAGTEDDFKIVDLLDFDAEDDVRIVKLRDVDGLRDVEGEEKRGCNWIDQINWAGRADQTSRTGRAAQATPILHSFSGLKSRRSRRRQIVQSAVVTVLVVAGLLAFTGNFLWAHSIGAWGGQSSTASAPAPVSSNSVIEAPFTSAPLIIDATHYYIESSPFLMQILIDGHALAHVPLPGVDPPLLIFAGKHLIMWRMNNHQTFRCTVSVPQSLLDTCEYDGPTSLKNGVAVWIITIPYFRN